MRLATLPLFLSLTSFGVSAQVASTPCSLHSTTHDVKHDAVALWRGITSVPRNAIRPRNLEWELPIGAATGVLIAEIDRPAADRIESKSLQDLAGLWSNVGLGIELGSGGLAWTAGCLGHHSQLGEAGVTALTAVGAAGTLDLALKLSFDRQFPYSRHSTGEFWVGGRSFPSGHSATSFAFASVVAHRYPHNRWIKWGAYALATGVSLSRYPAKKHFASDILVGGTLGYVTGTYIADHTPQ
ncbi:MAG TPA: phosphatase PAP2 family protein [Terriglobales bacterium]|nr:phosphatase PAP2 family protein [Terriglobales bacterium]